MHARTHKYTHMHTQTYIQPTIYNICTHIHTQTQTHKHTANAKELHTTSIQSTTSTPHFLASIISLLCQPLTTPLLSGWPSKIACVCTNLPHLLSCPLILAAPWQMSMMLSLRCCPNRPMMCSSQSPALWPLCLEPRPFQTLLRQLATPQTGVVRVLPSQVRALCMYLCILCLNVPASVLISHPKFQKYLVKFRTFPAPLKYVFALSASTPQGF